MVVDPTTNALVILDFNHYELHAGSLFTANTLR